MTPLTHSSHPPSPPATPVIPQFFLVRPPFQKQVLLDFQLKGHEKFLAKFRRLFRENDSDNNGVLDETEFKNFVQSIDPTKTLGDTSRLLEVRVEFISYYIPCMHVPFIHLHIAVHTPTMCTCYTCIYYTICTSNAPLNTLKTTLNTPQKNNLLNRRSRSLNWTASHVWPRTIGGGGTRTMYEWGNSPKRRGKWVYITYYNG